MPSATDPPPAEAPKPSKGQVFARRLASTVALWGLVAATFILASPWMFLAMVVTITLLGLIEYFHLFIHEPGRRRFRWLAYAVGLAYVGALFAPVLGYEAPWLTELDGAAVAALSILVVLARLRQPLEGLKTLDEIAVTIFGFIYIVLLFGFVPKTLLLPLTDAAGANTTHYYILYLLAVTKFTDMGAYAIGSLIGRDKMVPNISPGKTWQGFGGAIFGAYVASYGCLGLFGAKIPLITPVHAAILALALALVAVLGDLAESILKRSLAAKDSGHALPGIGGVMDLIDSILFTAPILYFYLLVILP